MKPGEFDIVEAALIERGAVLIENGIVLPGRNIWLDEEIKALLPRCLEIMRKERKGVYAADIDLILKADRKYYSGKTITLSQRMKLSFVMPKILMAGANELGEI
jgi:hypothetical protein